MVAHTIKLIATLLLTLCLGTAAHADEAQDALVEQGVQAYDDGDYQRAKDILLPLAEAGHPEAMHIIGRLHEGLGGVFPKDPTTECDWYEKAANKGLAKSMYNMSICFDGNGRPDDPETDKTWLLKAAEHGFIPAMINLAGMDQAQGENYRHWMNQAVEHGSKYAQVSLWLQGYKEDVPDISTRDILCVSLNILIFDGDVLDCD